MDISERVREVIEKTGLNRTAFAEQAGLDASKLSKSLSGARRFSSLDLANIAEIGGVTVDWLLGTERSKPAVAARAATPAGSVADKAIETAETISEVRAGLAGLGYRARSTPELRFAPAELGIRQGADLAQQALARLPEGPPGVGADLFATLERCFGIEVAVQHLNGRFDGLAWIDDDARVIVVGTTEVPTRQRFTLAHELAHILAGDDQLHVDEDVMEWRRAVSELRANSFAAHFLMPEAVIAGRLATDAPIDRRAFAELVMHLAVSPDALAWRLHSLARVSPAQRDQFRRMSTVQCAHLTERTDQYGEWRNASKHSRSPAALTGDALDAYLEGKITLRPVAQLCGLPVETLRDTLDSGAWSGPYPADEEPVFNP
ncbi:ImmA/IrrE family metallo-endopeptidase [Saccharopolyspora sp. HNM0986]|uniref:helix-turn-helix domain-containing protein n=1 Tax=Saccharopolyspora galaxeae TaxID=2781241 RepID=UPI0019098829|nr:XRE family transcriptional regulator [Saccharopolyspora sp. HNM0986]MBK0869382.1 ImmA/IrrE family metallo-endopeptidase [Saccharopolyspora sp. HNM0986]